MRVIIIFSLLFLVSCESEKKLRLDLKHIIKTSYEKPGDNCKELNHVTGFAMKNVGFAQSYEKALDSILKETHSAGGNFLFIKRASTDGTNLDGIAYSCASKKEE